MKGKEMSLPWNEKVVSFQLNPESATIADIVRMAEELVECKKALEKILSLTETVFRRFRIDE
jgi:hypothetical protein